MTCHAGGDSTAGARRVKSHLLTGTFGCAPNQIEDRPLPKINKNGLTYKKNGDGSLYGVFAPDSGRVGGLTGPAVSSNADDFFHLPGYSGHRPEGWAPHVGKRDFGGPKVSRKMNSKNESHISSWGRPPQTSGVGFLGNQRIKETVPRFNKKGHFKSDVEDEIEETGRRQMQFVGDTAYSSLRQSMLLSRSLPKKSITHAPTVVHRQLASSPDGYSLSRASVKDVAIFQGSFPTSRHVPGFSGHVPGGVRR